MNDAIRGRIRGRMAELGLSQGALAQQITGRREAAGEGGKVERVHINRAINHGGSVSPLLGEILEALGLQLTVEEKSRQAEDRAS